MPAPKTAEIKAEVIKLLKGGHSTRAIEAMLLKRRIKVGRTTVSDLARQFRAGALQPAKQEDPPTIAAPPAALAEVSERVSEPLSGPVELDPTHVADLDLRSLARGARLADRTLKAALRVGDIKLVESLLKTRERLSMLIARLRPPVLPDPAKDPANVTARDELRAKLERAVEASQASDAGLEQLRAHLRRAEEAAALRHASEAEPAPEASP